MSKMRETGVVKQFFPDRGFGFIGRPGGRDVFVNMKEVQKAGLTTLNEGDQISFTLEQGEKGMRAANLEVISKDQAQNQTYKPTLLAKPITHTQFKFGSDYLKDGYFLDEEQKSIRPEIIDTLAIDIAKVLGNQHMKSHQLRRFFNKVRGIDAKLEQGGEFETVRADIQSLKRDVYYQVGRGVVPDDFRMFIERNVELASQDINSFRLGFINHFESMLAYFVYFFRE